MAYRIVDIECYRNYFLLLALDPDNGTVYRWERHNDIERGRTRDELRQMLKPSITITFNGMGYDWWMLSAYLDNYTNSELKDLGDYLIKNRMAQYEVSRTKCLDPYPSRHIDIMPVAPLVASLKIYAGRLHSPKLQDLPISPDSMISESARDALVEYCVNDLYMTNLLHCKLKPQILLRHRMSKQYGLSLTSKSDPQIAEAVIKKLLLKSGVKAYRHELTTTTFKFDPPDALRMMNTQQMRDKVQHVVESDFKLSAAGRLLCPAILKKKVDFGKSQYSFGIGGLHSNEKRRSIRIQPGERLTDLDVVSYYPSLILGNELYPEHLGRKFLDVYQSLVSDRIAAKESGDKVTADALKIVINSSFGKFGNKYSVLYSPKLLLQTTFSGQLYLMMLIERIELRTFCEVVSANTDGITVHSPDEEQYKLMIKIARGWEFDTRLRLEAVQYSALFSQDVNNYLALKTDGSVKRKGVFAESGLSKNPWNSIVQEAAIKFLTEGIRPEITVAKCRDFRKFCSVRKVDGGALYRDEVIGKTVRWYQAKGGAPILYMAKPTTDADGKDGYFQGKMLKFRKVPEAELARVVMNLPDQFPRDINFAYYIDKAYDLIEAVGGLADSSFRPLDEIDEFKAMDALFA